VTSQAFLLLALTLVVAAGDWLAVLGAAALVVAALALPILVLHWLWVNFWPR